MSRFSVVCCSSRNYEECGLEEKKTDVEIPKWLKGLAMAPEFRPTDTEFADPIASLSKCSELGSDLNLMSKTDNVDRGNCNGGVSRAVFTTRHQELGSEKGRRVKGVGGQVSGAQKQVWQSWEVYDG
ncbi:unnamed protein product [Fraxinus pennsylvanica]|uniref:Uncharacterized protein n=1 Tax=Fraxinus pennsylvanica TaxID=56036 RepID=A0AAD1Z7C8_9LAMI|nr:unnamed protein product [Fraxinus pennsylvanica]